jgi:hypothetical protein
MSLGSFNRRQFGLAAAGVLLAAQASAQGAGGVPIPGTGFKLDQVGDDFEDEGWKYIPNHPKSSDEQDKQQRLPAGASKNNRWFEPVMRGQPDMVKRIATPDGGPEGSTGSLYLASFQPGILGSPRGNVEQDDFCANTMGPMGGMLPIAWQPNCIARVYVPPLDTWEQRNGSTFGYRVGVRATHTKKKTGQKEEYWPGIIFRMEQRTVEQRTQRYIRLLVRANENGADVPSAYIVEPGWYTLGITCTANGAMHYFFREGVEDLAAEHRLASYFPYGYRAAMFETFFFNVLAQDNGRTWSTPWVVDDAYLYLSSPPRSLAARGAGGTR